MSIQENRFEDELMEIKFDKSYDNEETSKLKKGICPMGMDDKWEIVYSNDELSFYRSWTGLGVFKIIFSEQTGNLEVEKAFVLKKMFLEQGENYCASLLNWTIEVVIFKNRDVLSPELTNNSNE
jgi:hypothetical protein